MNSIKPRKPWLSFLLNFFMVGLGHVYAGKPKKGVLLYIGFLMLACSVRTFSTHFYIFVGIISLIAIYYLWVLIEGAIIASKNRSGLPRYKWYIYLGAIILQSVLINIIPKKFFDEAFPINLYMIPTPSMNSSLLVGDFLAVGKTKDIKFNDIAVFKYPLDPTTAYIFRCVGTPGSTLQVKDGYLHTTNYSEKEHNTNLKFGYLVKTNGTNLSPRLLTTLGANPSYDVQALQDRSIYLIFLTESNAQKLSEMGFVDSIEKEAQSSSNYLFPQSYDYGWNVDNYGPIHIPKEGETIQLNTQILPLYADIILQENSNYIIGDSTIQIFGKTYSEYTFQKDYYFMMGDNRHNANDSRFWGFVSEDLLLGKGLYLYWSQHTDRIGMKIQ